MKNKFVGELTTIGDHIKKKRYELNLRQEDIANIIGVSMDSVTYWENNRAIPTVHQMPKIIQFLGYCPIAFDTSTLAGRLKQYRHLKGLSHKKLGKILEVDSSTVGCWELGKYVPSQAMRKKLEKLLTL